VWRFSTVNVQMASLSSYFVLCYRWYYISTWHMLIQNQLKSYHQKAQIWKINSRRLNASKLILKIKFINKLSLRTIFCLCLLGFHFIVNIIIRLPILFYSLHHFFYWQCLLKRLIKTTLFPFFRCISFSCYSICLLEILKKSYIIV
jgi:hypothetical protein